MYYKEKISPVVNAERGTERLSRSENLALIKKITAEMWAVETPEVKELVRQRMEEQKTTQEQKATPEPERDGGPATERTPEEFQT
jgi:hypothetical protein